MKLAELFDQLVYGELANTVIGKQGINRDNHASMVTHINLGLYELYKRFNLKKDYVIVQQYAVVSEYTLSTKYALSNTDSLTSVKYIVDNKGKPFKDNILKIETIENIIEEEPFIVGQLNNPESIQLNTLTSFTVPKPKDGLMMKVVYRANHDRIIVDTADLLNQEIELPITHLESLLLYVASRYHGSLPSIDGVNEGAYYLSKFERSCAKISELGLAIKEEDTNYRIGNNGWNW